MTDRKPDFYVVKRAGLDDAPEWFTYDSVEHSLWDYQNTLRHRFVTQTEAAGIAKKYGGSVVPVFCTTSKAEPKMRERSSSWVLKRLAEGKVVVTGSVETLYRFTKRGVLEFKVGASAQWGHSCGLPTDNDGLVLCRIAKPEEVPT